MNAMVMYDRETDTLWSQFLGEAVEGQLTGTKLDVLASQLTTWGEWKNENPDTLVLDTGTDSSVIDSYSRYYLDARTGRTGQTNYDDRLFPKELVVGVTANNSQRAYAFKHLKAAPIVNDTLEDRSIVVVFNGDGGGTAVFDRTVDERTLTFAPVDDSSLMSDEETGSVWSKSTGEAVSGPLEGELLQRISSFASFWFAWNDFYPGTEVYVP